MLHSAALDPPQRAAAPVRAEALTLDGIAVTVAEPGGGRMSILDIPALRIAPGQSLGIAGPSGAGKTTLLHVIAGLVLPQSGTVRWGGETVTSLAEEARDRWRRRHAGFVFQDFALVPEMSVLDNILLPATLTRWRVPAALRRDAVALAGRMGLARIDARTGALSRGEQQRVAVARALLPKPALLLADEPTASLDAENGKAVTRMLVDGARENGATFVVVSHDAALLGQLNRVIRLEAGRIASDDAV